MVQTRTQRRASRPAVNTSGDQLRAKRCKSSANDGVNENESIGTRQDAQGEAGAEIPMEGPSTVLGPAVHAPPTGTPKETSRSKRTLSSPDLPFGEHTPPSTSAADTNRKQKLARLLRDAASEDPLSTHTCDLAIHALLEHKLKNTAEADEPPATIYYTPVASWRCSNDESTGATPAKESTSATVKVIANNAAPSTAEQQGSPSAQDDWARKWFGKERCVIDCTRK